MVFQIRKRGVGAATFRARGDQQDNGPMPVTSMTRRRRAAKVVMEIGGSLRATSGRALEASWLVRMDRPVDLEGLALGVDWATSTQASTGSASRLNPFTSSRGFDPYTGFVCM